MEIHIDDRSGQDVPSTRVAELAEFAIKNSGFFEDFSEAQLLLLELSISYVSIDEIAALNSEYRGIAEPTDVLSFEMDAIEQLAYVDDIVDPDMEAADAAEVAGSAAGADAAEVAGSAAGADAAEVAGSTAGPEADAGEFDSPLSILLGDIVINPDVAKEHALLEELNLEEEIWVLVIHGILHLLGYDHTDEDSARIMEELEDRIFNGWLDKLELASWS